MRSLILVLFMAFGTPGLADYVAYSVSEKGDAPLPEDVNGIEPQYLVNIRWGDFQGARSRLAVLEVDNTSSAGSYSIAVGGTVVESNYDYGQVPVNGIEAIITDALARTARFRLVERQALGSILQEQDLVTEGRIAKPSGAATGNILGAQYLVQAVVTNYEADTGGKGFGVGGLLKKVPLLGGVKVNNSRGVVGMNFRLIDAETSEILYTKQVDTELKSKGLSLGGVGFGSDIALGGFLSNYSKTPIGQAVIASCNEGVFELIKQVGAQPAEGAVIKADARQIYVNLGQDQLALGDTLQVLSVGEELIDPETGISLGAEESMLGDLRVTQVAEKFSIAQPVNVAGSVSRGDRVRSTKLPAPLEYPDAWNKPK